MHRDSKLVAREGATLRQVGQIPHMRKRRFIQPTLEEKWHNNTTFHEAHSIRIKRVEETIISCFVGRQNVPAFR